MSPGRRRFLPGAIGAALAIKALPASAHAQTYPSKPLRLLVGYAPGGGQDQVARLLGQGLAERTAQQVLIEN